MAGGKLLGVPQDLGFSRIAVENSVFLEHQVRQDFCVFDFLVGDFNIVDAPQDFMIFETREGNLQPPYLQVLGMRGGNLKLLQPRTSRDLRDCEVRERHFKFLAFQVPRDFDVVQDREGDLQLSKANLRLLVPRAPQDF